MVECKIEEDDQKKKKNSIVVRSTESSEEPFEEKRLSVGRIVHIVTLCSSGIRVTRFRPK